MTRALFAALLACSCSDPAPAATSEPARPTPQAEPAAAVEAAPEAAEAPAAEAPAAAPPSQPVDLLHAVPTAIAVSSVYRDRAADVAKLVDGDPASAWNSRTGDLGGAWIDVRLPADATVTAIELTAGFTRASDTADLFTGNHRIARVRVLRDGTEVGVYPLDTESRALQSLPVAGGGGTYRIEVAEVLPGSNAEWRETCVSELRVMGRPASAVSDVWTPATGVGALPALSAAVSTPRESDDAMYFVLSGDGGVVRLGADARFRSVGRGAGALVAAPDGALYLRWARDSLSSFTVLSGAPERTVEIPREISWVQAIAPHAGGGVWAIGFTGAAYHDGSSWTVIPLERADYRDITVASDGTVFVLGTRGIYRRNGSSLEEVPVSGVTSPRYGRFILGAPELRVSYDGGMLRWDGRAWTPVTLPAGVTSYSARYRADGTAALARGADVVLVQRDGRESSLALATLGVRATRVGAMDFDGTGRLWLDTDVGLVVIAADLTTLLRHYPRGSIRELPGQFQQMFARGAGPGLPEAGEPDGHVHGTLRFGGAPLANAHVELCAEPARSPGSWGTPCEGQPLIFGGTTQADGTFDLWEVSEGAYDLAVERPDHSWYVTSNTPCCLSMRSGRVFEMRAIDVPARR
jgi:hypothetical protein